MGAQLLRVKWPQQAGRALPSAGDVLARRAWQGGPRVPGGGAEMGWGLRGGFRVGAKTGLPVPSTVGFCTALPPPLPPSPIQLPPHHVSAGLSLSEPPDLSSPRGE